MSANPAKSASVMDNMAALVIKGADAPQFLHSQFSNHVLKMTTGDVARGSYSSAKGMVQVNFLLFKLPDGFVLCTSSDLAEKFAARLSMFVLRADVQISPFAGAILGFTAAYIAEDLNIVAPQNGKWVAGGDGQRDFMLAATGLADVRYLWLGDAPLAAKISQNAALDNGYLLAMLQAGEVWVDAHSTDQYVAQMLNLDLIGAVDFQKGCYAGQEYIARTQYRGKVRSRCAYFVAAQELPIGAPIVDETGQECGSILNTVMAAGSCHLLANVRSKTLLAAGDLFCAGIKLARQALPYDLQLG